MIDAVGDDDDVLVPPGDGCETAGGVRAHAHAACGARRGGRDHPPEEQHLRALVPLRMVEEGQVVERRDRRDREPMRERVVRSVPDVGAEALGESWCRGLLPEEARRAQRRHHRVDLGTRCAVLPARVVAPAGDQDELDAAGGSGQGPYERFDEGERVHAGSGRAGGNRRDVDDHTHRFTVTPPCADDVRARRAPCQAAPCASR